MLVHLGRCIVRMGGRPPLFAAALHHAWRTPHAARPGFAYSLFLATVPRRILATKHALGSGFEIAYVILCS